VTTDRESKSNLVRLICHIALMFQGYEAAYEMWMAPMGNRGHPSQDGDLKRGSGGAHHPAIVGHRSTQSLPAFDIRLPASGWYLAFQNSHDALL